jgi:hypothetical protein
MRGSNHFIQEGRIAGDFARRLHAGNRASSAAHQESHMRHPVLRLH